jgi:hypothetical protein
MTKNIILVLLGIIGGFLLRSAIRYRLPEGLDSGNALAQRQERAASGPTKHAEFPDQHVVSNLHREDSATDSGDAWLIEAHLQDILRSVEEDTRVLKSVLDLSSDQEVTISNFLKQTRLTIDTSTTTEYDLISGVLTPEQQSLYDNHLEHKRRLDAEQLALLRTYAIEKVTGPLQEVHRERLYQAIAQSLIAREPVAEGDIVKSVLDDAKYNLWLQSSLASPVQIDK